ncbi:MAG: phosphoenolpyruvate hydrolase family protein, partial [Oscillospiraceae bacterium]
EGGADLIIVYNSGMFRMAGRGSSCGRFAYSDANGLIFDMSNEILSSVKHTPVIAGIFGSDPYRNMERLLNQVCERGFSGIQNFPTMGNLSGIPRFYTNLCETGYGYDKEIEMVRLANKLDLLTTPYCFNENQAMRMVDTGTDIIVAHMGLTTKGMIGAALSNNLDDCVEKISKIARAAKSVNPNVLVISHGGAVSEPEDAQYIYDRVPETCGFYGASSAERIPTENALIDTVKAFKAIRIGGTL